jgi:hypothetical protein
VNQYTIFDETKSKDVIVIEILSDKLEQKFDKEEIKMKSKPNNKKWFEMDSS